MTILNYLGTFFVVTALSPILAIAQTAQTVRGKPNSDRVLFKTSLDIVSVSGCTLKSARVPSSDHIDTSKDVYREEMQLQAITCHIPKVFEAGRGMISCNTEITKQGAVIKRTNPEGEITWQSSTTIAYRLPPQTPTHAEATGVLKTIGSSRLSVGDFR
jgi:hypothetical protein